MEKINYDNLPKDLFEPLVRTEDTSEQITAPSRSFGQNAWITLRRNKAAMISIFFVIFVILMAIFAPMASQWGMDDQLLSRSKLPPRIQGLENISWLPFDGIEYSNFTGSTVEEATTKAMARYKNPPEEFITIEVISEGDGTRNSAEVRAAYEIYKAEGFEDEYFWLGTDTLGRDQWTRLWLGTRVSLIIAFVAAVIDVLIGITWGGISGYFGGRVDDIMQRILEVLVGIPSLVIILLMMMFMKPGMLSIIIALTITGWTSMARIVRGEVMKYKNEEFVMAAKTLGTPDGKIIRKHIVPNISGIIIVNMMMSIPSAVFFEAFLSFIGLGIAPPQASLGALIDLGFDNLRIYPFLSVYPAGLLSLIMIAFNLIGDGLRDAFDPRMHKL